MTPLRQRMREDMQLCGLSPKTQACYLFAVQQFAQHYGKFPALIPESTCPTPVELACLSIPSRLGEFLAATSITLHPVAFLRMNHDAVYPTSAPPNGTRISRRIGCLTLPNSGVE